MVVFRRGRSPMCGTPAGCSPHHWSRPRRGHEISLLNGHRTSTPSPSMTRPSRSSPSSLELERDMKISARSKSIVFNNRTFFSLNAYSRFWMMLGLMTLAAVTFLWTRRAEAQGSEHLLSRQELEHLRDQVRGDDYRIMRWNATSYTRQQQQDGGCQALPRALHVVVHSTDVVAKATACEYVTFCITDNPTLRAQFSTATPGILKAVVMLVSNKDPYASAMAAHLIYIASFANADNHKGFVPAGAVSALAQVIKNDANRADQIMWAAAALQNLAASYCATADHGRCYWGWISGYDSVLLNEDSLPVISDGRTARTLVLEDKELVKTLTELACQGPVKEDMSDTYPYPGDNARIRQHETYRTIIPWAAMGALKNLALELSALPIMEEIMPCICRMSHSRDWLEENKGNGLLHHARITDPCWFDKNDPHSDKSQRGMCIDDRFVDVENYTCYDYGRATAEDCEAADPKTQVKAKIACCGCLGGRYYGRAIDKEL